MAKYLQTWADIHSSYYGPGLFPVNDYINQKICLVEGNLEDIIDADVVVNAANSNLTKGEGICGVIFDKAGSELDKFIKENHKYKCPVGDIVTTPSFNMKQYKEIIHAVGPNLQSKKPERDKKVEPTENEKEQLQSVYLRSLIYMKKLDIINAYNPIKTIVFPCISTGIFAFDNVYACHLVLHTIRLWLECNPSWDGHIVLCCYDDEDHNYSIYLQRMGIYFPKNPPFDFQNVEEEDVSYAAMKRYSSETITYINKIDNFISNHDIGNILQTLGFIQQIHDNIQNTAIALQAKLLEEVTRCTGELEQFRKDFQKRLDQYWKEMTIRIDQMLARQDDILKILKPK